MKRAFSLVELIIITIILGILVSLGALQFSKVKEKARAAEARGILGIIRQQQQAYKLEHDAYATSLADLNMSEPEAGCVTTHFFVYDCNVACSAAAGGGGYTCASSTRCTSGGKDPDGKNAYVVELNLDTGQWGIPDDII